jgi:hypothetical protein
MASQFAFAQYPVVKGKADLVSYSFVKDGPIELNGEWEFYMSQLLSPKDFQALGTPPKDYVDFPSEWTHHAGTTNFGFATYRLRIAVSKSEILALNMPHCYSSYKLWANGKVMLTNGVVGTSRETSTANWLPKTTTLPGNVDTITLVLQVSNFHHAIGGIRKPLVLGNSDELTFRKSISTNSNVILIAGLAAIAFIYLFVFLLYKSSSVIFFALMSLTWGLRAAFSNEYLAIFYMPDFSWELAVKIEYISLFLIMILAMLFIGRLFKEDVNKMFKYLYCFCNLVFIALTMFFKASVYTQFLPVYLAFAAVLIVYIVYVLARALVYERQGVWLIITCVFLAVIIFAYDLISYQGLAFFNPIITSIGYLTMFALMAIALLFHVGIFKRSAAKNMLTYEDLYGGNNSMR